MKNKTEMTLQEYLCLPYTIELRRDDEGDVVARIKELDGCVADGAAEMEALANLEQAKKLWLAAALKANQAIPLPEDEDELPSGKWLTRVPRSLHQSLIEIAKRENVSLNQLVAVGLAELAARKTVIAQLVSNSGEEVQVLEASAGPTNEYSQSTSRHRLRLVHSKACSADINEEEGVFLTAAAKQLPGTKKTSFRQASYEGGEVVGYN